jgi:hypothetical protein
MTLCIAAICNDVEGQDAKIVLCSDWERSLPGTGSSETADKIGFVKTGWPVLIAGTITRAEELLREYAGYLSVHFAEINEFNIIEHLRKPVHLQKCQLVDSYLQKTFAFDRKYFHGDGAKNLPESFILEQQQAISQITLDAQLIIAGFIPETDCDSQKTEPKPFFVHRR